MLHRSFTPQKFDPKSKTQKIFAWSTGATIVEFALVVPLLFMVLGGIMECGRAVYTYSALTNAIDEGARYGSTTPTDTNGIKTQVVATAIATGINSSNVFVSCSPCTSGNPIRVEVVYSFQPALPMIPNFTMHPSVTVYIE